MSLTGILSQDIYLSRLNGIDEWNQPDYNNPEKVSGYFNNVSVSLFTDEKGREHLAVGEFFIESRVEVKSTDRIVYQDITYTPLQIFAPSNVRGGKEFYRVSVKLSTQEVEA